jgi:hypothetical protein
VDQIGTSASQDYDAEEWRALLRLCLHAIHLGLWALWAFSLYVSLVLFWAFTADISAREGLILGLTQATWVAGIPVALLFVSHLLSNGWQRPKWRIRWVIVAAFAALWIAILWWWLQATPYTAAYPVVQHNLHPPRSRLC